MLGFIHHPLGNGCLKALHILMRRAQVLHQHLAALSVVLATSLAADCSARCGLRRSPLTCSSQPRCRGRSLWNDPPAYLRPSRVEKRDMREVRRWGISLCAVVLEGEVAEDVGRRHQKVAIHMKVKLRLRAAASPATANSRSSPTFATSLDVATDDHLHHHHHPHLLT